jgi:hypothetical protein
MGQAAMKSRQNPSQSSQDESKSKSTERVITTKLAAVGEDHF